MKLNQRQRRTVGAIAVLAPAMLLVANALISEGRVFGRFAIGIPAESVRCLPWRVYLLDFGATEPLQAGDLVLFPARGIEVAGTFADGTPLLKMVRAVGGDEFSVVNDIVHINGRPEAELIHHPVLDNGPGAYDRRAILGKDQLIVMGTHPASYDSRYWGAIESTRVEAKAYALF